MKKKSLMRKKRNANAMIFVLVTVAFIVMQLLSSFGMLKSSMKGQLIPICVYIVLAVSLNLVVGVSGELSLGHAGFMGVGAFTGVVVAASLRDAVGNDVIRLILAMVVGGIMAGLAGGIIGIPVLRLRGDYLAIVTLAFGEILKNIIGNLYIGQDNDGLHFALDASKLGMDADGTMILNGPMGTTGVQKIASFGVGFALIIFSLIVVLNLIHSKEGRAIMAIRDNRIAAESVGLNIFSFKIKAFMVSAFLAGMAGALYGLNYSAITSSKFDFTTSIDILVFVVLGGMGNIGGSVISAALLYILPEMLRGLYNYRMIMYAVVLIAVMLFTWSPQAKNWIQKMAGSPVMTRFHGQKKEAEEGCL